ncbi:Uma2 family endonuclease [Anthocerotibacter panamensis]|uniref:Uma2 family endonuclease n=1 Tax=Anthocerotibacter panamensis TaxID=2857077 RepID=UPI002479A48F|nr:Uma2 family endonuclease [Anthocerotibacter panamensis]
MQASQPRSAPTTPLFVGESPEEIHRAQVHLLGETFRPPVCALEECFIALGTKLFYDLHHPHWYKEPDWFAVLGVPQVYEEPYRHLGYLVWHEGVSPFVVVELLCSATASEDLGHSEDHLPPTKWEVYERILRIPYYIAYDPDLGTLHIFQLQGSSYEPLPLSEPRIWLKGLQLGLGLWQGAYRGLERSWLRWYDQDGVWLLTRQEQEEQQQDYRPCKTSG